MEIIEHITICFEGHSLGVWDMFLHFMHAMFGPNVVCSFTIGQITKETAFYLQSNDIIRDVNIP